MDKIAVISRPSKPKRIPVRIGEWGLINLHTCPYGPNLGFDLLNFLESQFPTTFFQTDKFTNPNEFR
jgi:hypothetical protein